MVVIVRSTDQNAKELIKIKLIKIKHLLVKKENR